MKTVKQIRQSFWENHPEFKNEFRKSYRQNQYHTDIRVAFVEYVDYLQKDGQISEKLARKATL